MENIQQITQAVTFDPPEMFKGEKNENVAKTSVDFQQLENKPVDTIVREVEKAKESSNEKEDKNRIARDADIVTSILNNKLKIVSDDRSRTGLVVRILDRDSGDTVKQFPSEDVLNMIDRLKESIVGVIVDDKA